MDKKKIMAFAGLGVVAGLLAAGTIVFRQMRAAKAERAEADAAAASNAVPWYSSSVIEKSSTTAEGVATLSFTTKDAPALVAAFYEQALPKLGWAMGKKDLTGSGGALSFSKAGKDLTLSLYPQTPSGTAAILSYSE